MITGFNTDIVHGGVTYHVQTEDKGVDTPLILSLVYDRGTILASKRTPYDDLIAAGFDEKVLAERLQKQHKLICAAVKAGRIEELKKMTAKDAAVKRGRAVEEETPAPPPPPLPETRPQTVSIPPIAAPVEAVPEVSSVMVQPETAPAASAANVNGGGMPAPETLRAANLAELPPIGRPAEPVAPQPQMPPQPPPPPVVEPEPAQPVEMRAPRPTQPLTPTHVTQTRIQVPVPATQPPPAPAPATPVAPAIPQPKETFVPAIPQPNEELVWDLPLEIIDVEDVIIDDAAAEPIIAADAVEIIAESDFVSKPVADSLEIEFLNETNFRAGERKTLNIRVYRGEPNNFVTESQVMVKVLGSSFRPLIFHARTNTQGVATVHLQLPQFRSGRGAILVRAIHDGEEAELRQIVKQN